MKYLHLAVLALIFAGCASNVDLAEQELKKTMMAWTSSLEEASKMIDTAEKSEVVVAVIQNCITNSIIIRNELKSIVEKYDLTMEQKDDTLRKIMKENQDLLIGYFLLNSSIAQSMKKYETTNSNSQIRILFREFQDAVRW